MSQIEDIREKLRDFLSDKKKLAILALGNILRKDDAAGVILGRMLDGQVNADVFIAEMAPEAFVLKILDGSYTHVIIVDSVIGKGKPGDIVIVGLDEIADSIATTHSIPLTFIIELMREKGIKVIVVGIVPKETGFGEGLSDEVDRAVKTLRDLLIGVSKDQ